MMSSDILSFTSRLCFYSQVSVFIPILKGGDVQGMVELEAIPSLQPVWHSVLDVLISRVNNNNSVFVIAE